MHHCRAPCLHRYIPLDVNSQKAQICSGNQFVCKGGVSWFRARMAILSCACSFAKQRDECIPGPAPADKTRRHQCSQYRSIWYPKGSRLEPFGANRTVIKGYTYAFHISSTYYLSVVQPGHRETGPLKRSTSRHSWRLWIGAATFCGLVRQYRHRSSANRRGCEYWTEENLESATAIRQFENWLFWYNCSTSSCRQRASLNCRSAFGGRCRPESGVQGGVQHTCRQRSRTFVLHEVAGCWHSSTSPAKCTSDTVPHWLGDEYKRSSWIWFASDSCSGNGKRPPPWYL